MTHPGDTEPAWEWLGAADPSLRVAGHSHLYALRMAMGELPAEQGGAVAVFDAHNTANHEVDSYWTALERQAHPVHVLWGGNEHAVVFMLSDEPITIVGPRQVAPPAPHRVIPYVMVKALWRIWLTPLAQFLARHPSPELLTIVGTPPPKPEDRIREGIATEPLFVEFLETRGLTPDQAPVVDTSSRVASWDALQECFHEVAAEGGAGFIGIPADVMAPDGTLRPEYCSADATHANAAYGLRMWSHLLAAHRGHGL